MDCISHAVPETSHPETPRVARLGGILTRKTCWCLSWRGWLLVAATTTTAALVLFSNIYPFLAVTKRVNSDTLVVEGWIDEYAIQAAVKEVQIGAYKHVFATGGPVRGNGGYVNDYQTAASVGADLLKKFGLPSKSVQMVPSHVIGRDRTYSSAIALRDWLREHNINIRSLNVVTEDVHARRTRLLFAKAFGPKVQVGIIAIPNPDYDAKHWWWYSEGVERVIEEMVGYFYAAFFFHPSAVELEGIAV
jgi:uncharacterized SAM-binding protein YcdF (DUF218 family)